MHEADDLVASDPRDRPKKLSRPPWSRWRSGSTRLAGGLLKSLTAIVDPNVRTLVIVERKLVTTKAVSDTIKLAHVGRFLISREGRDVLLTAEKKEGGAIDLARSPYNEDFVSTADRLATKVMIPLDKSL